MAEFHQESNASNIFARRWFMHRETTGHLPQSTENKTNKNLLKARIGFVFPLTRGARLSIISLSSRVYGTIARQGEASLKHRSEAESKEDAAGSDRQSNARQGELPETGTG